MTLNLQLDDYLAQWFVHEHGGEQPVRLPRASVESSLLQIHLTTPPRDWDPTPPKGSVAVILPQFTAKDTRSCHWLPPRATAALVEIIRARFDLQLWKEVHPFRAAIGRKDLLIEAFMEKHGIEVNDRNYQSVLKRYQRKCDVYRKSRARAKKTSE